MTIDRRLFLSVVVCLSLWGAGCGGGGESARNGVHPATRLRTLQSGDNWVYDVTNYISGSLNQSGRNNVSITKSDFNGQSALVWHSQLTSLFGEDGKSDSYSHYLQDKSSGDLLAASGGDLVAYPEPVLVLPGEWKTGLSRSFTGNGDRFTLKVTGQERITVPAGTFDTWRMEQTQTGKTYQGGNDYTITSTCWVAPETGSWVKVDSTTKYDQADEPYRFTSILRTTNTRQ